MYVICTLFCPDSLFKITGNCIFQIILEHHTVLVKVWHVCRKDDDNGVIPIT